MQKITIVIKKDGETTIDVDGVKGTACTDLTNLLVSRIGEAKQQDLKQEYYDADRPDFINQGE